MVTTHNQINPIFRNRTHQVYLNTNIINLFLFINKSEKKSTLHHELFTLIFHHITIPYLSITFAMFFTFLEIKYEQQLLELNNNYKKETK